MAQKIINMANAIRMCINCRTRNLQPQLIRLQCIDRELVMFTNNGRSFYLCDACLESRDKKLLKSLSRACKREIKITNLECLIDG